MSERPFGSPEQQDDTNMGTSRLTLGIHYILPSRKRGHVETISFSSYAANDLDDWLLLLSVVVVCITVEYSCMACNHLENAIRRMRVEGWDIAVPPGLS